MSYVQAPGYLEQRFLNLEGLGGLPPARAARRAPGCGCVKPKSAGR
jgi:hypothetical protein